MSILSIDQGTTGTTSVLYDVQGRVVRTAYRSIRQLYPQPGWVEHDPQDIWRSVLESAAEVLAPEQHTPVALGITNQRETTIVWDRTTGRPVYNAIVWQCRRTAPLCERLRDYAAIIRHTTGLPVDAYFSATKIAWICDHIDVDTGRLLFGSVDSWLVWNLTGGVVHATDYTNAARTMLFDIHNRRWDEALCDLLRIPAEMLPTVKHSVDDYGIARFDLPDGRGMHVPIRAVAGDQQAALFGQGCFARGEVKNTYGTGCFVVMNTGNEPVEAEELVTTLAVDAEGAPCFALEGPIFIGGAALQWLRDELKILDTVAESREAACRLRDNGGVYLVPAFTGMGSPHWNMDVRGTLVGLTRGTGRDHIIRAALESMAYQSADVIEAMNRAAGLAVRELWVDGGAAANDFLMQFQADILGIPVVRPVVTESTAQGAAFMAGLSAGVWKNADDLCALRLPDQRFEPEIGTEARSALLVGWKKALRQAMAP